MTSARAVLIWTAFAAALVIPLALAAASPLHAWRSPIYVVGGFAGIVALCLMLAQPLLIRGWLPGLSGPSGRLVHRWVGGLLVAAVVIHVAGLGIASPPDMIDALTFTSPTLFSPFGVVAMWAIVAVAVLVGFRRRFRMSPRVWRRTHLALAAIIVAGSVIHGLLIEGTMETMSKVALSTLVVAAAVKVMADQRG